MFANNPTSQDWPAAEAVEQHRIVAGSPRTSSISVHQDGRSHAGLWRVSPGEFTTARRGQTEFITILEGTGRLVRESGETTELYPGAFAVMEDGWTGRWVIDTDLVKTFVTVTTP